MSERKVMDAHISDADVDNILDEIISQNPQLNAQIEQVANDNNALLCEIIKIFPYEDKAYVNVLNSNRKIYCRLSHEVLGNGMCIDYLPNGVEKIDKSGRSFIEPYDDLYGIVLKVRWKDLTDENVLLGYVNIYDYDNLKSSNDTGEISIKSGESILSVDNDRVNIMTPTLFINGLPYNAPELENHYDKNEMDLILDSKLKEIEEQGIDPTHTHGNISNDGKIDTTTETVNNIVVTDENNNLTSINKLPYDKVEHQDITGLIDTAGTGLTKDETTINHTDEITPLNDLTLKKIKYNGTGHIIETSNVTANDLPDIPSSKVTGLSNVATSGSYNDLSDKPTIPQTINELTNLLNEKNVTVEKQTNATNGSIATYIIKQNNTALSPKIEVSKPNSSQIIDDNTYSNINNNSNTQQSINEAIDTKIGALLNVELIEVVSSRPSASANTMNKIYLVLDSSSATDDNYRVYVTYKDGNTYKWERLDTVKLDLSTKEDKGNKVTSWSNPLSNTNYPSEKLVKETIDNNKININIIDDLEDIDEDGIYLYKRVE